MALSPSPLWGGARGGGGQKGPPISTPHNPISNASPQGVGARVAADHLQPAWAMWIRLLGETCPLLRRRGHGADMVQALVGRGELALPLGDRHRGDAVAQDVCGRAAHVEEL